MRGSARSSISSSTVLRPFQSSALSLPTACSEPPPELANIGPTVAFALLAHGLASGGGRYLVNRFVARIGVVSFSIYLWHFEIVMLLRGAITPQHGWHGAASPCGMR